MEPNIILRTGSDLSEKSHGYLSFLYRPLMMPRCSDLYESLYSLSLMKSRFETSEILEFCALNEGLFVQLRKELERFFLLSTYTDEKQNTLCIYIYAPLPPREFLRHDLLGRLFLARTSSSYYQKIKTLYGLDDEPQNRMKNISEKLQPERLEEQWSQEKEIVLQKEKPAPIRNQYPFDWNDFFKGMQRTFPERLRTESNKARISMLAGVYGMNEKQMRRFVARYINDSKSAIDFDRLENDLQFTNRSQEPKAVPKDLYQLPPVQFLGTLQSNNSAVLPSERKLVQDLATDYSFAWEVVNTLLEYCMKECDMAIVEKYVRTVANTWARNGIDTRQKALEFINREPKKKYSRRQPARADGSTLPDWYKQTETTPASDELVAKALAVQKELFGKGNSE